ncbi:MAG: hypothetical protein KDD15_14495 [Lewinella sp.]|nr:hypothetical protein [Lewinella sp.]
MVYSRFFADGRRNPKGPPDGRATFNVPDGRFADVDHVKARIEAPPYRQRSRLPKLQMETIYDNKTNEVRRRSMDHFQYFFSVSMKTIAIPK